MMKFEDIKRNVIPPEEITELTPDDVRFWSLPAREILQGLLASSNKRVKGAELLERLPMEERYDATIALTLLINEGKIEREELDDNHWLTLTPASDWYKGSFRSISEWHRRNAEEGKSL
jgi:hypothetical protein